MLTRALHDGIDQVAILGAGFDCRTLGRAGEPWTFGLDPAGLRGYLDARGLALIEDLGSTEYRARDLGSSADHVKGYEFYRIAVARADSASP